LLNFAHLFCHHKGKLLSDDRFYAFSLEYGDNHIQNVAPHEFSDVRLLGCICRNVKL